MNEFNILNNDIEKIRKDLHSKILKYRKLMSIEVNKTIEMNLTEMEEKEANFKIKCYLDLLKTLDNEYKIIVNIHNERLKQILNECKNDLNIRNQN